MDRDMTTPPPQNSQNFEPLGSLLEPAPIVAYRAPRTPRLSPRQRTIARRAGAILCVSLVLAGGMWGIFALAPRPAPDYLDDDMRNVLDYTLLSEDFNKLPVERRLELIKELVERMKKLSGEDSAAMAAFAATIKKEMRRQMERNIKRLAVDTIDIYAKDYATTPPEQQEKFLDDSIIGFTRMMEDIAGENSPLPKDDAERIATIKDQAKRDEKTLRENDSRPTADRVGRFFEFIHNDQENVSDPVQRGRNAKFMRDMTRHLRGQDVATGRALPPG
jgi:hypothetical protein